MIQAEYLGIQFKISDTMKRTLDKVDLTYSLKTEEGAVANGVNQIIIKGNEAQSIIVQYPVSPSLGTDVIQEYNKWFHKLGQKGDFFLGEDSYGVDEFILHEVTLESDSLSNNGRIEYGTIKLTLKQDEVANSVKKSRKKNKEYSWGGTYRTPKELQDKIDQINADKS